MVSGTSFINKKNKRTRILKKILPKHIRHPLVLGSEIRDPEKIHPRSGSRIQGVKKNRITDPDPQHCMVLMTNKY
jgi:hypothetical protein